MSRLVLFGVESTPAQHHTITFLVYMYLISHRTIDLLRTRTWESTRILVVEEGGGVS
jgi:hypothetical protein